jgi:UDP-N-acetylmuramyl pentapeptide phosphotransferase/UDP-N-acetylglucosamine-1-phosphate transferase
MWQTEAKPFVEMQRIMVLPSNSRYFYYDRYCGVFAYGLPLGILLYPRLAMIEKHRGEKDVWKTAVVCITAILAFVIAFSDFCIGGVNMRYVYDISVMLALISAAVLINLTEKSDGIAKSITGIVTAVLSLVSIWTNMGVVETIRIVLGA